MTEKKAASITIKYSTINSAVVTRKVRKGATLGDLAEDLQVQVQSLRVNGDKKAAAYVIQADDFIVAIDTEVAGA